MRLIDADKLIDDLSYLKKSPWANEPWLSDQRKLGMREAIDMIQSIVRVDSQTVDAVPVIRCKDCKFAHLTDGVYGNNPEVKYCDIWFPDVSEYMPINYYCASAERKEE